MSDQWSASAPELTPQQEPRRRTKGDQVRRMRTGLTKKRVTLPLALVVLLLIW